MTTLNPPTIRTDDRRGERDPLFAVNWETDEPARDPIRFTTRSARLSLPEVVAIQATLAVVVAVAGFGSGPWWAIPPVLLLSEVGVTWWLRTRGSGPSVPSRPDGPQGWRNPIDLLVPTVETGQISSRGGDTVGLASDGRHWLWALRITPGVGQGPGWAVEVMSALEQSAPAPVRARMVLPLRTFPDELLRRPASEWPKEAESLAARRQDNPGLLFLSIPQRGPFGHLSIDNAVWLRNEIRQTASPLRAELQAAGLEAVIVNELQLRTEFHRLSFGPEIRSPDGDEPGTEPGDRVWCYHDRYHIVFEVVSAEEATMTSFLEQAGRLRLPGLAVSFARQTNPAADELPPRGPVTSALVAITHLSEPAAERAAERIEEALHTNDVVFRRLDRFHRAGFAAMLPIGPDLPRRVRFLPRHRPPTPMADAEE